MRHPLFIKQVGVYISGIKLFKTIPEDSYLNELGVVRALSKTDELRIRSNITFLVGEKGIGKSTLIEAIAVGMGFNPEGGGRNFNFASNDTHSNLWDYLTICRGIKRPHDGFFLRAESFYNFASNIDEISSLRHIRRF